MVLSSPGRERHQILGRLADELEQGELPSEDPQLGVEGAGILDGLEDGHQIPGRDADRVQHLGQLPHGDAGFHVEVLGLFLRGRDLLLVDRDGLALAEGLRLAHLGRGGHHDGESALDDAHGADLHIGAQDHGAGLLVDHDPGLGLELDGQVLEPGHQFHGLALRIPWGWSR